MTATATLSRPSLRAALAMATKVVDRRSTIPVLANVRLRNDANGFHLVGTDLDIELRAQVEAIESDAAFDVTLPAHKLAELEKKAAKGDSLSIVAPENDNESAKLNFGGMTLSMETRAPSDFPTLELGAPIHAEFDIPTADLLSAIEQVEFAISTEETRYYLNGIFAHVVDGALTFVTTDGHRLAKAVRSLPAGAEKMGGIIIPRRTVALLHKLLKARGAPSHVHVKVNTVKVLFTLGTVSIVSKLVDGTFPDYARVIPRTGDKRATFHRATLMTAIESVVAMTSERGRAVKFAFDFAGLECNLSCVNLDLGRAETKINFRDGVSPKGPLEIGFNGRYVLDILATIEAPEVTCEFSDANAPALITAGPGTRETFVLMPMRV